MYKCVICNYNTNIKCNLSKHLLTKKHQRNITRVNVDNNTNEDENNKILLQNALKLPSNALKLPSNALKLPSNALKKNK